MRKEKAPILTITFDNRKELANHKLIEDELNVKVYFADPYSSYQRGINKYTNELIRQFFFKKNRFQLSQLRTIKSCEDLLNKRPRKKLGFYH